MKLIPFAAFPLFERDAVRAALRASGTGAHGVCVSRVEFDPGAGSVAMVTAPGFNRSYDAAGPWTELLLRDLVEQRSGRATMPHPKREETP
jgi:hypothetical protein